LLVHAEIWQSLTIIDGIRRSGSRKEVISKVQEPVFGTQQGTPSERDTARIEKKANPVTISLRFGKLQCRKVSVCQCCLQAKSVSTTSEIVPGSQVRPEEIREVRSY